MLKLKHLVLLLAFVATPSFAADSAPSEQSIKQLLTMTDSRKQIDHMMSEMDNMMKSAMQQAMQGQNVTPKQQKILDDMQAKKLAVLKEELNWDVLEPLYVKIYRESFTQEEIDGILAFYSTPAGKALIQKMPIVLHKSTEEMQKRMGAMMQKLQKIQQDAHDELKANQAPAKSKK